MKIVFTDSYTLGPDDLDLSGLKNLGEFEMYDRSSPEEIMERCGSADVVITNKNILNKNNLQFLKKLKLIAVSATGYNIIDTRYARENNISVSNVPDYGTDSVAQHTFALLLELTNNVGLHNQSVHEGDWENSIDFCYVKSPITELSGKVLGIIGFGKIGQKTAEIARAFGMVVKYNSSKPVAGFESDYLTIEELLKTSDFISLHCPLKPENTEMVNESFLRLMKKNAYLINTSRGQLINENDLANALNDNIIAGAALDVLSTEPPKSNNPLLKAKNCIITPHNAWQSREARQRIVNTLEKNISSFFSGLPTNIVN